MTVDVEDASARDGKKWFASSGLKVCRPKQPAANAHAKALITEETV